MNAIRRVERAVLGVFARGLPLLNWAFFLVGIAGAVGTIAQWLPPFNDSLWARITSTLLWLLLAREGYDSLATSDRAEEEAE